MEPVWSGVFAHPPARCAKIMLPKRGEQHKCSTSTAQTLEALGKVVLEV